MRGFAAFSLPWMFVAVVFAQSHQQWAAPKPIAAEAERMMLMQANAASGSNGLRIQIGDWSKLNHTVVDTCANRGAEQGFATWSLLTGRWGTGPFVLLDTPAAVPPQTTTSRFAITPISGWDNPAGFDRWVGTSTPQVPVVFPPGSHTFRLGNHKDSFEAVAQPRHPRPISKIYPNGTRGSAATRRMALSASLDASLIMRPTSAPEIVGWGTFPQLAQAAIASVSIAVPQFTQNMSVSHGQTRLANVMAFHNPFTLKSRRCRISCFAIRDTRHARK